MKKLHVLLLAGIALSSIKTSLAQPATVPGVRMQEPDPRPEQLATDTLPAVDGQVKRVSKNRYLSIDVTGTFGRFRRYRIFPGETMAFRAKSDGDKYRYPLTAVSDTAFTIAFQNELYDQAQPLSFPLVDVKRVYLNQRIPFVSELGYLLPVAAVIFVAADFVNPRSLDGRSGRFLFDRKALVPGGLLLLGGAVCYKLSHRSYSINDRNRLKVLWTN
ncbi:hypothetical protein [Fibrella aquatica]|uniref:hypothetical protein n=1 Tax=Fibrella aquatica TaxID=3242487 RepID=UPI00352239C0